MRIVILIFMIFQNAFAGPQVAIEKKPENSNVETRQEYMKGCDLGDRVGCNHLGVLENESGKKTEAHRRRNRLTH